MAELRSELSNTSIFPARPLLALDWAASANDDDDDGGGGGGGGGGCLYL